MRSVTHSVSPPILLSPPPPPPPVEHMLSTALGGGSGCACLCLVRGARVSYHLPENTKTISKEAWGVTCLQLICLAVCLTFRLWRRRRRRQGECFTYHTSRIYIRLSHIQDIFSRAANARMYPPPHMTCMYPRPHMTCM